ncbi:hypothetical protein Hanom_Chr11g00971581 [Helianthus anomalus]
METGLIVILYFQSKEDGPSSRLLKFIVSLYEIFGLINNLTIKILLDYLQNPFSMPKSKPQISAMEWINQSPLKPKP